MSERPTIAYLDRVRVILTVLVVLHHSVIAYGGSGSWYYTEKNGSLVESIIMLMFNAVNQSFFMALFFFVSALLIDPSRRSKGNSQFVRDRLRRLGIPLIFYSLVLSPLINFIAEHYGRGDSVSFAEYIGGYTHWIDFGVLWFVAALLIFTFTYVLVSGAPAASRPVAPPRDTTLLAVAVVIALISFVVRIAFPVGWTLQPLGFQLAHFTQYIAYFSAGIIVSRNGWLESLPGRSVTFWFGSAVACILIFPLLYVVKEVTGSPLASFTGGLHWQSVIVCLWEQVTGVSISMFLLSYGARAWTAPSNAVKTLSRATYATYIFHPIVIVAICVLMKPVAIDPAGKLLILALTALPLCFVLASALTRVPVVKEII